MSQHNDLQTAKKNKKDEFYTSLTDIEKEMKNYTSQFKGKIVFCNCDDPEYSMFWKYFQLNFQYLGLKKLIATHFDYEKPTYKLEYDGIDIKKSDLQQNGDFRSPECLEILSKCDIVCTNPPFSMFHEFIDVLMKSGKQFIIIGNINAVKYSDVFPYIMDGKLWLGQSIHSGDREFRVPDDYPLNASSSRIDENGVKYIRVKGVRWFTNMDYNERHDPMILYKHYTEEEYPHYDNYDAIEVSKTAEIPGDYNGIMGVPITALDKLNFDQFELLGMTDRQNTSGLRTKKYTSEDNPKFNDLNAGCVIKQPDGTFKSLYTRFLIKRKG